MAGCVERMTRVERPRSQAAVWCQRLAVFCLPYLLIVILGHRFGGCSGADVDGHDDAVSHHYLAPL